jgi:hypothetical protein
MISDIRARYGGSLTYSANANSLYFDEGTLPFWDALNFVGLSMYIEVADSKSPSVASIMEQWKKVDESYVRPLQQRIGLPIVFTEIDRRSMVPVCSRKTIVTLPPLICGTSRPVHGIF